MEDTIMQDCTGKEQLDRKRSHSSLLNDDTTSNNINVNNVEEQNEAPSTSTNTYTNNYATNMDIDHSNPPPSNRQRTFNPNQIKSMKLEAIFHPKFENENINNQQIRKSMLDKVSTSQGVLEVSLKHSGSLVLWSGSNRFYSKNATDNVHTHTAEILLRQHFARAWMKKNKTNDDDDDDDFSDCNNNFDEIVHEQKYIECSNYIESNRLTLSFEVVTSVLGHHGDLPNKDFLILIAVADRTTNNGGTGGTFLSTTQVMEFAQRFRLPHNDVWIFQSLQSAKKLFHLYDNSRENGLADSVIHTLNEAADGGHIQSLYPHGVFQGQILEGIVIRFVRIDEHEQGMIEKICEQSDIILKQVPPDFDLDLNMFQSIGSSSTATTTTTTAITKSSAQVLKTKLRDLYEQSNDATSFARAVEKIVKQSLNNNNVFTSRTVSKLGKKEVDIPSIASRLLLLHQQEEKAHIDYETHQICTLIKTLEELKLSVSYHVISETSGQNKQRYLCIIHILHDACHQKYHFATRTTGGMSLFRGFSIELVTSDEEKATTKPPLDLTFKLEKVRLQSISGEQQNESNEEKKLMLKMKFLPYMVRTFICRNGMSILAKKGTTGFNQYAFDLLRRWDMSKSAIDKWIRFINAWGRYCESPSQKTSDGKPLPSLNGSIYLHHYYHFEELYNYGFFKAKFGQATSFYGLVVVVGMDKEKITKFCLELSSTLGCSKTVSAINDFTEANMAASMQSEGGGVICAATITEGVKKLKLLEKRYKENIYLVMIGCTKEEIEADFVQSGNPNSKELKKMVGMTNGWKKLKLPLSIQVPNSCLSENENIETNDNLVQMVAQLKEASKASEPDHRPGILVYFPNIPGCGKSFLCSSLTRESLQVQTDRELIVREGDKTTGKFWPLALQDKLKQPSSIFIADKNVPPPSWKSVDSVCAKSNGVAVCVLPDSSAFEDTTVDVSFTEESGEDFMSPHRYPFSLHFLAVCMSRVLNREPNTHNGKLDSATENACMIVVKFYCLYRSLSVSSFIRQTSRFGRASNHVIRVPFFKTDFLPELPTDLQEVLEEAISLQTKMDLKQTGKYDMSAMETNLRSTIKQHQDFVFGLQIDPEESSASFMQQLSGVISSLGDKFQERELASSSADDLNAIRIVSLDFKRDDINSILLAESTKSAEINNFLTEKHFSRSMKKETKDDNKKIDRFINNTHCTFAHAQRMRQDEMRKVYGHVIGISCEVKVNAILFSDDVAALDITIPKIVKEEAASTTVIPPSTNEFTHVTIWCKKGTKAFRSNQLPILVEQGTAKRVEFHSPVHVKGIFSYWYD